MNYNLSSRFELNNSFIISRVIQIIALKNQDVYNAQSVTIHIYGCAPIGQRPRQDGVRSGFFEFVCESLTYHKISLIQSLTHFCILTGLWHQDCCQYHPARDGDGWVEYRGSLVFDRPQKVIFFQVDDQLVKILYFLIKENTKKKDLINFSFVEMT